MKTPMNDDDADYVDATNHMNRTRYGLMMLTMPI